MREFKEKFDVTTWTLLRLAVGVVFVVHGWSKLTDIDGTSEQFASMGIPAAGTSAWLAVAGEFLGGLGLIFGALTPLAAIGTLCVMVTAILFVHIDKGLLAQNGGFEYPLTLLAVSLAFIARGAGPISVDAWIRSRRQDRKEKAPATSSERHQRQTPAHAR